MTPIRKMLSESGLTEQQWRVLRILDEHGALESTQLAKHAALLLPSQTRIVQSMTQKGLVVRREHHSDRRRTVIEITEAGQAIINDNATKAAEIAEQIRDRLGPRRCETLLDILDDLGNCLLYTSDAADE